MYLKFYNPPSTLLASGSKVGVELGGSKSIISIDSTHNFYTEGMIYTEMSWGAFYSDIEGLEDQIDTFTTKEYDSIREDPEALANIIVESLDKIMKQKRLFYGIGDFEVDAFMNQNTLIPGLTLERNLINTLMEAHKKNRDEEQFPKLINTEENSKYVHITIQGTNKQKIQIKGKSIETIANNLKYAKGSSTGIVVSSNKSTNFFIMNDTIIFKEGETPEFYIDEDCITVIESGIERDKLFPISWFRFDLGISSLETLELWEEIKDNEELKRVLHVYESYISGLIIRKYIQQS
ncbi:MAG: hypothetical protein KGD57_10350 [Candidatus Lokiarchaeota archaeon]|nr:hypothetical protein [Candidatus Lokiarchaeota archaeon]